jgi:pseudo-response regulator 7
VVGTNGDSAGNSGSGSGVDNSTNVTNRFAGFNGIMPACTPEDRFAWREAALNKFRQKRKERCFAKKVPTICLPVECGVNMSSDCFSWTD